MLSSHFNFTTVNKSAPLSLTHIILMTQLIYRKELDYSIRYFNKTAYDGGGLTTREHHFGLQFSWAESRT